MPIAWQPFVALVQKHQHFVLTTHVNPDGDALGSLRGLGETLERLGKQVRMTVASNIAPRYDFLNTDHKVEVFRAPGDAFATAEAVVVLDTGTWNQLGEFGPWMKALDRPKAVIDHHQTQDDLGALQLVDASAEATGRLVHEAAQAFGVAPSASTADALFVALATDTGWFRHANTRAETFALAAELIRAGARPTVLYDLLFERNNVTRLKLTGRALDRLRVVEGGLVAYTEVRLTDYVETGAVPQDSADLVGYARSITGVEVGLLFTEQQRGGVKVSFRSRSRIDVSRVAEQFGGGGHRLASGATLDLPLDEARVRVLAAVQAALAAV